MRYHFLVICSIVFHLLTANLRASTNTLDESNLIKVDSILKIDISSSINPATFNYIESAHKKAVKDNHELILITLNTPGGLVSTTKKILTTFGSSDIPFIVWVSPEGASATSAGAIIASGAHILVMAEGTNIGAATPIQMSGEIKESDVRKKSINDLVALVESLAETRGRNALLFSEMISKASSFKSKEARDKNLIDAIVNTQSELLNFIDGRKIHLKGKDFKIKLNNPTVKEFEMDLGQKLLNILANPSLAYVLFLVGAALIYLEFQAPGGFIAGALGAFVLILAGIGFQVLPLNFGALALLAFSFVLFLLEIYITSYGILSIAGLASLVTGSLFLFRTDNSYIHMSTSVIVSATSAISIFLALILYIMLKERKIIGSTSFNGVVGKEAIIVERLEESEGVIHYQIKVSGEFWKAVSESHYDIGAHVKVKDLSENKLEVII